MPGKNREDFSPPHLSLLDRRRDDLKTISDTNAYVLGGGTSSRMKKDKAFLEYDGKLLIDISIERVYSLFERVFLVGRDYESPLLTRCLHDEVTGVGPLGGILTALMHTDREHNFFIGIDYPCTDERFVLALHSLFKSRTPQYEGLIPIGPDGPHPLLAFYDKSCLSSVESCVAEKEYRILCIARRSRIYFSTLLKDLSRSDIVESDLEESDHHEDKREIIERNLININNDEDYILSKKLKKHK